MSNDIKRTLRASKIPQKIAQSSNQLFNLKPSISTTVDGHKLSTKLSHILFRQKSNHKQPNTPKDPAFPLSSSSSSCSNMLIAEVDDFNIEYYASKPADDSQLLNDMEASTWFRNYFIGKPYITLIGSIKSSYCIISIIKETKQYRMIARNRTTLLSRFIVQESSSSIKAVVLSIYPNLTVVKELTAEATILSGLEKELLRYDELQVPKNYKFGLLTIHNQQTTEEEWFSNNDISTDLDDFLNIMGQRVDLKNYTGYAAGLDTKTGESGECTFVSKWNHVDITFHVAPLMPSKKYDKQQILRKKHIGNDIVCIIFLQGDQVFNPKAIKSQFLHVYIVVKPEIIDSKRCWRVQVTRKATVQEFGPTTPPVFYDDTLLKQFLTSKLVHAENASLRSDRFSIPNKKARLGLFDSYVQTGLLFDSPLKDEKRRGSTNSKLLKRALLEEERRRKSQNDMIPPVPYISKSTMLLQDFKKGIVSSSKRIIGVDSKPSRDIKTLDQKKPSRSISTMIRNNNKSSTKIIPRS